MSTMRHDDVSTWTIDKVVYELCLNDQPIWMGAGLPDIPAKDQLEEAIRSNHIDGSLLLELSPEELKLELNIKSLGQRKAIDKAIRFLRGEAQPSVTPGPFTSGDRARRTENWIPTPDNSRFSYNPVPQASVTGSVLLGRPSAEPSIVEDSPKESHTELPLPTDVTFSNEFPSSNLALHPSNIPRAPRASCSPLRRALPSDLHTRPVSEPVRLSHTAIQSLGLEPPVKNEARHNDADNHGGLLDNLEAHVLGNLADSTNIERPPAVEPASSPATNQQPPRPKEKRRIAPTLIGPIHTEPPTLERFASAGSSPYLSQVPLLMQDTFYDGDQDEETEFTFVGTVPSPPQARVTSSRMMKFLFSQPIDVPGLGYSAVAKIPYRPHACAGSSRTFFTLFAQNVSPSLQPLKDWPALLQQLDPGLVSKKSSDTVISDSVTFSIHQETPIQKDGGRLSELGEYAYLLDKYPVAENDESDLLPVYGDSGDENEYDEETWKEIDDEKEQQKLTSSFLSREEAATAIDQALEELEAMWRVEKLPKVQMRAYRLWMKVAKVRRRQEIIAAQYSTRNRKLAYLEKMRDHLLKDRWRSTDQIKRQCESLEETLFQSLEAKHLLEVLHQNEPPPKPPPQPRKRRTDKPVLQEDDEEILESDSDSASDLEQEPAIDLFIVEDAGDISMPDDPADPDFDPVILKGPRSHQAPAVAISPVEVARTQDATTQLTEPQVEHPAATAPEAADTPGNEADVSDNDSEDDRILASADKQRSSWSRPAPRETVNSDDWSSSTQQSADSDDENSDMDAPSRLPPSKYKSQGKSLDTAIELLSSDPTMPGEESTGPSYTVETPPLNTPDSDDVQSHKPRTTLKLKLHRSPKMPKSDLDDERGRRRAVLRAALRSCDPEEREEISNFVQRLEDAKSIEAEGLSKLLYDGLMALHANPVDNEDIPEFHIDGVSKDNTSSALKLTLLMISYINRKNCIERDDYTIAHVNNAFEGRQAYFSAFKTDLCAELGLRVNLYEEDTPVKIEKSQKGKKSKSALGKKRKRVVTSSEDELLDLSMDEMDLAGIITDTDPQIPKTPHSKKKKKITQSKEVRETLKDDQLRVREQEQRRAILFKKMQGYGTSDMDIQPINAQEPVIMLDKHIAARVKPHQVNGIQFLWREIVTNPKHQGCLLAHTMGLGKTMQVISLLVTIAQSRSSQDEDVVTQLPKHIRENNCTLILCPPSLVDNWYDELLMWSPPGDPMLLGLIVKISGGRTDESGAAMAKWAAQGGVLIMSYDTFRSLLVPSKLKVEHQKQVEEYERLLLETPSIVVADEAHKLKNAKSKISVVSKRFNTRSRIALTGSPLNNHLEEYHTMVEWIAPNYLGDMAQFRSKYVDPITAGLYADSTGYERRTCLRKLHVLKKDLEPKVNRADITAIRSDMPPKTEYIITIPLAEQQRKAYDLYVAALLGHDARNETSTAGTSLFKWLNKLMILVNHPSCFIKLWDKYEELHEKQNGYESSTDAEKQTIQQARQELSNFDNYDPLDVNRVSEFDSISMRPAVGVFNDTINMDSIEDVELSYRTDISYKILQKAVAMGDKTLVFSQSIATLDYLEKMLRGIDSKLMRIDGGTAIKQRQKITKDFNYKEADGDDAKIILISTRAGGLGLNLQGANRVIIFDSGFNPMWEEQAVGRAYRLGQTTPVFVYRFKCGGTFEEPIYNKALFKTQLFQRVVDKKNPTRAAEKSVKEYLFLSKDIKKQDFSEYVGRDPRVLDAVLGEVDYVHNIELTETFQKDDGEALDEDELKKANAEYEDEVLRRQDPARWHAKQMASYRPSSTAGPSGAISGTTGVIHKDGQHASRPGDKNSSSRRTAAPKSVSMLNHEMQQMAQANHNDRGYEPYYGRQPPTIFNNDGAMDIDSGSSDSVSIDQVTSPMGKKKPPKGCENQ